MSSPDLPQPSPNIRNNKVSWVLIPYHCPPHLSFEPSKAWNPLLEGSWASPWSVEGLWTTQDEGSWALSLILPCPALWPWASHFSLRAWTCSTKKKKKRKRHFPFSSSSLNVTCRTVSLDTLGLLSPLPRSCLPLQLRTPSDSIHP